MFCVYHISNEQIQEKLCQQMQHSKRISHTVTVHVMCLGRSYMSKGTKNINDKQTDHKTVRQAIAATKEEFSCGSGAHQQRAGAPLS